MSRDEHRIDVHLSPGEIERLQVWAERAGVPGSVGDAARAALLAFLDDQPPQLELAVGSDLSATEHAVMQRITRGEELQEVASALGLSPNAVAQARYRALKKGAGDRERVTLGQMRERAFERAAVRVLGSGPEAEGDAGFLRPPPDLREGAPLVAPRSVLFGIPSGSLVGDRWDLDPREFRAPKIHRPLTGLTNRIGPTLWASTQLVLLAGEEGPVTPAQLLQRVVPEAWRIGAGLDAWEEKQRVSIQSRPGSKRRGVPFHFSARWPSMSGPETREASSLVGFVNFSIGEWRGRGRKVSGPLFTLGLAELLPTQWDEQPLLLRPTHKAVELAAALGRVGASNWYPYDDEAWHLIRDCLATAVDVSDERRPVSELHRAVQALRLVHESRDTPDFQEGVGHVFEIPVGRTSSRRNSEASGHLARLRELGLVTIPGAAGLDLYRPVDDALEVGSSALGPDAVTRRGRELLRDYPDPLPR